MWQRALSSAGGGGTELTIVTKTGTAGAWNTFTLDGVTDFSIVSESNSNIVCVAYWDSANNQYVIKNSHSNYGIRSINGNQVECYVDVNPVTFVYYAR